MVVRMTECGAAVAGLLAVFCVAPGAAAEEKPRPAVTAGWENVCPARREFPPVKVVWTAPRASAGAAAGFTVRREGGAEGEVTFDDGAIRIRKTNDRGRITVSAPSFSATKGKALRFFADVSARTDAPDSTLG